MLYTTGDVYDVTLSTAFWVTEILFGSFFLVNLILAVLFNEFSAGQEAMRVEAERAEKERRIVEAQRKKKAELTRAFAASKKAAQSAAGGGAVAVFVPPPPARGPPSAGTILRRIAESHPAPPSVGGAPARTPASNATTHVPGALTAIAASNAANSVRGPLYGLGCDCFADKIRAVLNHKWYTPCMMTIILANTAILGTRAVGFRNRDVGTDLLDAPTALAACCGFDLCHKYFVCYLYLYSALVSLVTCVLVICMQSCVATRWQLYGDWAARFERSTRGTA